MKASYILGAALMALTASAQRQETLLKNWQFTQAEDKSSASSWSDVVIPHDWAIYGPFDVNNDLQVVAIEQNGETEKTLKTGRTGGLPFIGKGYYRTSFELPDTTGKAFTLVFDGAMSNAQVRLNGKELIKWPYGYNSFFLELGDVAKVGKNDLEVDLENKVQQSRWYPGAGLYRNVRLIESDKVHIPVWGTYVTTPIVKKDYATVNIKIEIAGANADKKVGVNTEIIAPDGTIVAERKSTYTPKGQLESQNLTIDKPLLWSPEHPSLYTARTCLMVDSVVVDTYDTRFGIRKLEYIPEKGFYLNGEKTKFRGVCNHHDLGPLGAAVNKAALRKQVTMLKDMGANAIRTSHNMPAPELVELCDELGMMLMVEPFDDWGFRPKSPNGYGSIFYEWVERDITNMVKQYRNSPAVVMWSSGNEVPSQWGPDGISELLRIQDLIHELDPTRPVTNGMDQIYAVLDNGFAAAVDIPGFNYKPQWYLKADSILAQGLLLGSETASTVSSRGVYHFPIQIIDHQSVMHPDNQSSSYDVEACYWSNIPDVDFAADEDIDNLIGQFVWTGFDYLGEPTPYDTDAWPSHSSYFGIIDLASIPKDRYYLYRAQWNKDEPTLHILPHWNWEGREGEVTPIFVYSSYPKAELFINGKSQGVREKNDSTVMTRFRLMWNETVYEPGEVKVVAYDKDGNIAAEKTMKTAGMPDHLVLTTDRTRLSADGEDLAYYTVQVADKDGNIVPTASNEVKFKVSGAGTFRATANGDATSLRSFQEPVMDLFSGAATVIVQSGKNPGNLTITASAKGLKSAKATLPVVNTK